MKIVANSIQFLQTKEQAQQGGQQQAQPQGQQEPPQSEIPGDTSDFASEASGSEDDIPF